MAKEKNKLFYKHRKEWNLQIQILLNFINTFVILSKRIKMNFYKSLNFR